MKTEVTYRSFYNSKQNLLRIKKDNISFKEKVTPFASNKSIYLVYYRLVSTSTK